VSPALVGAITFIAFAAHFVQVLADPATHMSRLGAIRLTFAHRLDNAFLPLENAGAALFIDRCEVPIGCHSLVGLRLGKRLCRSTGCTQTATVGIVSPPFVCFSNRQFYAPFRALCFTSQKWRACSS